MSGEVEVFSTLGVIVPGPLPPPVPAPGSDPGPMLTIHLDGIEDDGSTPTLGVPARGGSYFEIPIGADVHLRLRVRHPDGTPACVGYTARLRATRRKGPCEPWVLDVSAVIGPDGYATLVVARATTQDVDPGRYIYDCWATAPFTPPSAATVVSQIIPLQGCALMAGTTAP